MLRFIRILLSQTKFEHYSHPLKTIIINTQRQSWKFANNQFFTLQQYIISRIATQKLNSYMPCSHWIFSNNSHISVQWLRCYHALFAMFHSPSFIFSSLVLHTLPYDLHFKIPHLYLLLYPIQWNSLSCISPIFTP